MKVSKIPPKRSVVVIPLRAPGDASMNTTSTTFVNGIYSVLAYFNAERFRRLGVRVLSGYFSIEWTMRTSDATVAAEGYSRVRMPRSVGYVFVDNPTRSTLETAYGTPGADNYYSEVVELDDDAVKAFNEGTHPTFGIQFALRTTGAATAYIYLFTSFLVLEVEIT